MPELNEIKRGSEIGKSHYQKYVWHACEKCGKESWVELRRGEAKNKVCISCGKLGTHVSSLQRVKNSGGYIRVWLYPEDFYYSMASKQGYILEHRLIMAKHLNRCLLPWEVVHHRNGIKDDNRIENLEFLPSNRYHLTDMATKHHIKLLERRIALLETKLELKSK